MRTPGEEGIIAARQEALTITEAAPFPHGTCILTGEDGENPDDCTTHGHEAVLGEHEVIDITPESCKTPEGAAKVNAAMKEMEDAAAELANTARRFFEEHERTILTMLSHLPFREQEGAIREDLHQVRALIGAHNRKQEAFLRAVAGR